jgi:hypothetical protein
MSCKNRWARRESNSHTFRWQILSLLRLPVSPPALELAPYHNKSIVKIASTDLGETVILDSGLGTVFLVDR